MASEQEEWTLALSKKTKRRGGRPSVPAEAVSKPNTIPRYTVEDLKTLRANARKIWQVSPERPKLIRLFKHQLDKYPHIIRKAICCGLGSADRAEPAPATHVTVFTQLEAFFDIVETIQKQQPDNSIKCYFQEPVFTDAEIFHIEGMGHSVLKVSEAEHLTAQDTFVYGPHLPWHVLIPLVAPRRPAVVMSNKINEALDNFQFEPATMRAAAESFMKGYVEISVPNYRNIIDGAVYWHQNSFILDE